MVTLTHLPLKKLGLALGTTYALLEGVLHPDGEQPGPEQRHLRRSDPSGRSARPSNRALVGDTPWSFSLGVSPPSPVFPPAWCR